MSSKPKARWSVEYLRERFILDRSTGQLFWKHYKGASRKWNTRWAGKPAGSLSKGMGYIDLTIDNIHCRAHTVVFVLVKGYWPENEVDHRNRVRNDNRPRNLREATKAQQRQNAGRRSDNTSGAVGVTWDQRRQVWIAQIQLSGKHYSAGQHATREAAIVARDKLKAKLHVFQPRVRET